MWAPWVRSPSRVHTSKSRTRNFSCSSFKDIQDLCLDDPESPSHTPKKPSVFHRVRLSSSVLRAWAHRHSTSTPPTETDHRVVVYYTSLRVVRKTFEDCRVVRSILRAFRVPIDERDLSMDSRLLSEMQEMIGCKNLTLPRVFIGGRYIGGADEIRRFHESGQLKRMIEGLPEVDPTACDVCGGHRYILCEQCDGSHKIYVEKSGFKSCTECNINGLIRCPSCASMRSRGTTSWL